MKFEHTEVMNFEGALRGMRNPLNSWDKSDSYKNYSVDYEDDIEIRYPYYRIGAADLDLAQRLIKGGSEHRKFLRQIMVCVDITAPLYWWKEFDTYKVGTTANSTSTMHKLANTPITISCFEMDDYDGDGELYIREPYELDYTIKDVWDNLINDLETIRQKYNETNNKKFWKELVRLLPEGWLQTRTVTMNYEILRNIYTQRRYHKLTEWHAFCDWILSLPYAKELITYGID